MTKIGDERIAFYLEHRQQIDEWARLKSEAANAIYTVFEQLQQELEEVANGLDGAPVLTPFLDGGYPAYELVERTWPPAEHGQRAPVAVTLETNRGGLLWGEHVPRFYLGVRVERSLPNSPDLHARLAADLAGRGFCEEKATSSWPCWRYVRQASERWWEDRQGFERTLVNALVTAWNDLAPAVRSVLESVPSHS